MKEDKIKSFVRKKRHIVGDVKISIPSNLIENNVKPTPWYRRPLFSNEFISKQGRDNKFYVRHKEWSERTYIGPYNTYKDSVNIINAYVEESIKMPLDKKLPNSVHSILIDDERFFV